jgi:hypothetical protein
MKYVHVIAALVADQTQWTANNAAVIVKPCFSLFWTATLTLWGASAVMLVLAMQLTER